MLRTQPLDVTSTQSFGALSRRGWRIPCRPPGRRLVCLPHAAPVEDHLSHSHRRVPLPLVRTLTAATLALFAACSSADSGATESSDGSGERGVDRAAIVARPSRAYREIAVTRGGTVRGVVAFEGDVPRDTVVTPTGDHDVCGTTLVDETVERMGNRLAGVVVWLADARSGKRLPLARRFEITNDRCQMTPRVQAALVGGTLNVRNADQGQHRNRLVRQRTGRAITLVSETDEGQVVPVEGALSEVGMVEVRCDQHPWTRGWVAVFDHPYYAVTARDGSFALDSVPPGTYRLVTWHERFGKTEQRVTVNPGREATVTVELEAK